MGHPIIITRVSTGNRLRIQWTEEDQETAESIIEDIVGEVPDWLKSRVFVNVSGYNNVAAYSRALPGKVGISKTVGGPDVFKAGGAVISVAFQWLDDQNRPDLTGAQKLGRASFAILEGLSGLGLVHLGATLLAPGPARQFDKWKDQLTADAFSNKNPLINALSDLILKAGGTRFQNWSMRPCWIDFY